MFSNLVSLINSTVSSAFYAQPVEKKANPYEQNTDTNPFSSTNFAGASKNYAKNMPVAGGYFAGYYNGVPNIVGRKLFIEV